MLPKAAIDWYGTEDEQWFRNRMRNNPGVAWVLENGHWEDVDAVPIAHVTGALSYLASRGARLSFGSDGARRGLAEPTSGQLPGRRGAAMLRLINGSGRYPICHGAGSVT